MLEYLKPDSMAVISMSKHKRLFLGQIGYRTRDGLSGLDPIENQNEAALIEGHFIRKLFTGKLRTRKPVYTGILLIVGLLLVLFPLSGVLTTGQLIQKDIAVQLVATLCLWPFGLAFLYNGIRSIRIRR